MNLTGPTYFTNNQSVMGLFLYCCLRSGCDQDALPSHVKSSDSFLLVKDMYEKRFERERERAYLQQPIASTVEGGDD